MDGDKSTHSSTPQWIVFVDQNALNESSAYLTGHVARSADGFLCVLSLSKKEITNSLPEESESEIVIGFWHGKNKVSYEKSCTEVNQRRRYKQKHQCVLQMYSDAGNKMHCCMSDKGKEVDKPPICVLFHPKDVLYSYILMRSESLSRHSHPNSLHYDPCNNLMNSNSVISSVIVERIGHFLSLYAREQKSPEDEALLLNTVDSPRSFKSICKTLTCILPSTLLTILSYLHLILHSSFPMGRKLLSLPSVTHHLLSRCGRSHNVLKLDEKNSFHRFIKYNTYAQQVLESLIGVGVLYYVICNNLIDGIATSVLDWADDVACQSDDLIKWLMGAPAGLKLNAQLTSMLGHFFIYHIYLWTGYLGILRTILPWFLILASWAGVLGVSFQLCIIKDIISMLTLHIYCFYVYAARIFNLQVSALSSLWRLFRGKKWNTLRSRVDSATYNTDQLFVGTLLFTVLLFLLPTTILYYAVFTGLRMVTLSAQGVLSRLNECLSIMPVYSLFLFILRPKWIAGTVQFDLVQPATPPSNLILSMKTSKLPLVELLRLTTPYLKQVDVPSVTWSEFFSCVTSGKILYPWVEITDEVKRDGKTKHE